MSQLVLNLYGRPSNPDAKSKKFKTIIFDRTPKKSFDFLTQTTLEEVKFYSKKDLRKFVKVCQATLLTFGSTFLLNTRPAMAQVQEVADPINLDVLPSEIMQIGLILIGVCAIASTILAIILAQLAGGYRMFQKRKEATEWTTDILKGYTQVLLAPVIVTVIAVVMFLLFKDFNWFVSPF